MGFDMDYGIWGGIFAVPCAVADLYLKRASEVQLKALLLALRAAPAAPDTAGIALRLGISEAAAGDALDFWAQAGLFRSGGDAPAPQPEAPAEPQAKAPAPPPGLGFEAEKAATGQTVVTARSRSKLTPTQINELMRGDPVLPALMQELQKTLHGTLSPADSERIAYIYSAWRLSADYLLMAVQYYVSIGKPRMDYIEKRIAEWLERGIDTHERAEMEIKRLTALSENESLIKTMFGISGRELSRNEKAYIETWCSEFGTPPELIRLAYDRAVDRTGKLTFSYINKILADWHRKGIVTAAEAEGESKPHARPAPSDDYTLDTVMELMEKNLSGGGRNDS